MKSTARAMLDRLETLDEDFAADLRFQLKGPRDFFLPS